MTLVVLLNRYLHDIPHVAVASISLSASLELYVYSGAVQSTN